MPEIDPKELRRLKSLETRLAKSQEEAKGWAAERKQLLDRVTEAEKRAEGSARASAELKDAREALEAAKKDAAREREEAVAAVRKEMQAEIAAAKAEAQARVKELQDKLKEAEKGSKAGEKEAAGKDQQISQLIEENRNLASQIDNQRADVEKLASAAENLREQVDQAGDAESRVKELSKQLTALQRERDSLTARVKTAESQLREQGKTPVLPATEVARLTSELVDGLSQSLSGMDLRDGEMKLKLAMGGNEKNAGFVVPTADSPREVRESLHELTVRFNRKGLEEE